MFLISEDYWEVRNTEEKGRGVFAKKVIDPGRVIGDYIGTVVKTAEEDLSERNKHLYLMYYHDYASIYPDLNTAGIHLLNHSCTPNCWMYIYQGHTLFFSVRKIFPGEELTISYLLSPQDEYCEPCTHECKCSSPFCTGTMHLSLEEYKRWVTFQEKEATRTKKKRIRYGKSLSALSSYPENIPDHPIYTLFGAHQELPEVVVTDYALPARDIRTLIRRTGRQIYFSTLNLKIVGVVDENIIRE